MTLLLNFIPRANTASLFQCIAFKHIKNKISWSTAATVLRKHSKWVTYDKLATLKIRHYSRVHQFETKRSNIVILFKCNIVQPKLQNMHTQIFTSVNWVASSSLLSQSSWELRSNAYWEKSCPSIIVTALQWTPLCCYRTNDQAYINIQGFSYPKLRSLHNHTVINVNFITTGQCMDWPPKHSLNLSGISSQLRDSYPQQGIAPYAII